MICKNCIHYNLCEYVTITDKDVDCKDFISNAIKVDIVLKMQEKILAKSEYGTINMSHWQLDKIAREVLEENESYSWVITENGCVITCPNCGERLELCYPDGTEVRYLPHCPYCGKKLEEKV